MKGLKFYLEYESKAKKRKGTRKEPGDHAGNVVAVTVKDDGPGHGHSFPDWRFSGDDIVADSFGAIFDQPNSDVASTSISRGYMLEKCKHISEAQAREIHPRLFAYLDD